MRRPVFGPGAFPAKGIRASEVTAEVGKVVQLEEFRQERDVSTLVAHAARMVLPGGIVGIYLSPSFDDAPFELALDLDLSIADARRAAGTCLGRAACGHDVVVVERGDLAR